MGETIVQLLIAASLPSAIVSIFLKRFEKRQDEKDKVRTKHEYLVLKSVNASLALGEATAEAVQRIPDAHCNGDMHRALDYAKQVKHEQKDFLNEQAIKQIC